jgi:hypothetical protein
MNNQKSLYFDTGLLFIKTVTSLVEKVILMFVACDKSDEFIYYE